MGLLSTVVTGYIFVTRDSFRECGRGCLLATLFVGYVFVTHKVLNAYRCCVSVPFVFVGYIFVTRDCFREYIRGCLLVWVTKM